MTDPRAGWLRRAGIGRLPDGSAVTWSVAEGARGRRWRWTTVTPDGRLLHAGLVEVDEEGRLARLELEADIGMLTLHPDTDRSMAHGNVVRVTGVDPIEVAWQPSDSVAIDGDPFGSAVAGWRGRGWVVQDLLELRPSAEDVALALPIDARGIPQLADAEEWPLER